MDFTGNALPLSTAGFDEVLDLLGVQAEEAWTILAVETGGCGYLPDRRPLILFERHIFHRQTGGAYDQTHPAISSAHAGGYLGGAREYERLEEAVALDRKAALNSASWGIAQIMGFNAGMAGFNSAEAMVDAMMNREDQQLKAMAQFLRSSRLHIPLLAHDWSAFARGYNGPDFAKNHYDVRLGAAYVRFKAGPLPDLSVRQAQVLLTFLDIDPGAIDGVAGKRTRSAVVRFRQQHGLPVSEEIDDQLVAALLTSVGSASVAPV